MQTVKGITQKKTSSPTSHDTLKKKPPSAFIWIVEGQKGLLQKLSNIDLRMEEHFSSSSYSDFIPCLAYTSSTRLPNP